MERSFCKMRQKVFWCNVTRPRTFSKMKGPRLLGLQHNHDVCDDAPPPAATVRHALLQAHHCRERLTRKPSDVEGMVWQILGISDHDVCEHDVLDVALCAFWSPCMQTLCDQAATMTVRFARESQLEGVQEAKAFEHPWQRLHA